MGKADPEQEYIDQQMGIDDDGYCECGKTSWEMCDCGDFFLNWQCGMLADGTCTLAGSEDCDWECPRSRTQHAAAIRKGSD